MTFHVIDKRTGKEPIFGRNHIFKEKWCKGRLIEFDIDGWYISEYGQLALVDDCCNMAYPPPDRYEVVFDEQTACDIEQIRAEIEQERDKVYQNRQGHDTYYADGLDTALDIIDKYKAERCGKE